MVIRHETNGQNGLIIGWRRERGWRGEDERERERMDGRKTSDPSDCLYFHFTNEVASHEIRERERENKLQPRKSLKKKQKKKSLTFGSFMNLSPRCERIKMAGQRGKKLLTHDRSFFCCCSWQEEEVERGAREREGKKPCLQSLKLKGGKGERKEKRSQFRWC